MDMSTTFCRAECGLQVKTHTGKAIDLFPALRAAALTSPSPFSPRVRRGTRSSGSPLPCVGEGLGVRVKPRQI